MRKNRSNAGGVANKVAYITKLHAPAHAYTGSHTMPETLFFTPLPEPVLHKVTLSWRTGKNLHAEIVKLFGPRRGNSFLNGLFLKKVEDKPWWSVFFNADDKILAGLAELREKISPWSDSDVQLKQAEVAWNIPFPSYRAAKRAMLNLADNALLQGVYARLWLEPPAGGKIQENGDGTRNGEVTAYLQQLRRRHGEYVLVKEPVWDAKMYLKEINGAWHLHIEITLEKRFLKDNGIPRGIPTSVSPDWLKELPLERFLKFASFNLPSVIDELRGLLSARQFHNRTTVHSPRQLHKLRLGIRELENAVDYPACEQKKVAYHVADLFKSVGLQKRIRDGKLDCPHNLFKE